MYYHWFPLEIVLMLLMLLGSINFVLHSEMWKGTWRFSSAIWKSARWCCGWP